MKLPTNVRIETSPDRGQDQGQFDAGEDRPRADPVHRRRVHEVVRDVQEGGVDQHHRDAHELPHRDERDGDQRRALLAEPRLEQPAKPNRAEQRRRDPPERAEDELPREAHDHDGEHRRQEDQRAVEAAPGEAGQAEQHREREADAVLDDHVDGEEHAGVAQRVPEPRGPERVPEQAAEIGQPGEMQRARLVRLEEAEADGVHQWIDREQGVDRDRRQEERRRVPAAPPLLCAVHGPTPIADAAYTKSSGRPRPSPLPAPASWCGSPPAR